MLTSSGKFIVESGGTVFYDTADIRAFTNLVSQDGSVIFVVLRMYKNTTDTQVGEYTWVTDATTINAEIGVGATEFDLFFSAVQLAVKTYLSGLNGGITFTIV